MSENKRKPRGVRVNVALISTLIGFVSLAVIFVALALGMWLGDLLGQRGLTIICMILISVPVSLFLMTRTALWLARYYQMAGHETNNQKEDDS